MIVTGLMGSLAMSGRETGELAVAGIVVLEVVVAVMAYQESNRFRWQHGTTPLGKPSWFWAIVGFFLSLFAAFPLWRARVVTMRRLGRTSSDPPVEVTKWLKAQPAPGPLSPGAPTGTELGHGPLPEQTIAPSVVGLAPGAGNGSGELGLSAGFGTTAGSVLGGGTTGGGGIAGGPAEAGVAPAAAIGFAGANGSGAANGAPGLTAGVGAGTGAAGASAAGAAGAAPAAGAAATAGAAAAGGASSAAGSGASFSRLSVQPAADWYGDPLNRHELRYWDGTAWTHWVNDAGVTETDPLV
jgi:hypothetical protein